MGTLRPHADAINLITHLTRKLHEALLCHKNKVCHCRHITSLWQNMQVGRNHDDQFVLCSNDPCSGMGN